MKRGRVSVITLLAILLVFALLIAGCGPTEEPPVGEPDGEEPEVEESFRVAMFHLVQANEYDQSRNDGMVATAAGQNVQVDFFSCEYDTQEQINQIQDAIAAGVYDAFIIHPNDSNAVVPSIEEALAEGIIVIGADGPFGPNTRSLDPYPEGVTSIIGRTGWTTGSWLGEAVVAAAEGMEEAKVAYLIGFQALTIDQDRFEALEEVIAPYDHIEVVSFQEGLYRRDTSREIMQNVFQANPDINIVVSSGDQMTLGAYDAAVEAGIADGIMFIGNGCSREGWQAIKDGYFFASYADIPYTQGVLLIETVAAALRGETVPRSINLEDQRPPLPQEGPMITADNIEQFTGEW
ncbi:MAG: sugar ABC transporter substrate-binding protein [Bacillota bacterium]|nr:sugar ABC transporter substrate-binding protein [Bacillota bacterium]